jgi:hypothetical protein
MLDFAGNGTDEIVYRSCCDDFFNYLVYLKENNLAYDVDFLQALSLNLFRRTLEDIDVGFHIDFSKAEEYAIEGKIFVDMYVKMWLRKYKQRVAINFDKKREASKEIGDGRNVFAVYFTVQERMQFFEYIYGIFIKNGELAFQKVLAENLIYLHLGRLDKPNKLWTLKEKYDAMIIIGKEAKRMTGISGPLIFITPNYSRMREWRDDGDSQRII